MYHLMQKDKKILDFSYDSYNGYSLIRGYSSIPFYFRNINKFIASRKLARNNKNVARIIERYGLNNDRDFIRLTHMASINDDLWVKEDTESVSWKDVNLYENAFSEVIWEMALTGYGINEELDSPSPELTADGTYAKCFRKEDVKGQFGSDIFIYKRSSNMNCIYGEVLASELAAKIIPDAVRYELITLHGNLTSRCNLFTDEDTAFIPYKRLCRASDPKHIHEFYKDLGCEDAFIRMIISDALTFNIDRHPGNHGILMTGDGKEMISPIFDLNMSFFPGYSDREIENHLPAYPKIGEDFAEIAEFFMTEGLRKEIGDLYGFTFSFRGDENFSPERIGILEERVNEQIENLINYNREKVMTGTKGEDKMGTFRFHKY